MASPDRARLARLMADMAAGDQAALFPFIDEFGDRLAAAVRAVLRSLGRADALTDRRDVDYLVQSAAFVIFDRADRWDPDGALPWTWAHRAIRAEVVSWLGHPSVDLADDDRAGDPRSSDGAPTIAAEAADIDFGALAAQHGVVALLMRALQRVASQRDAEVHLQYQAQKSLGDPSPAHTVADMFDLSPANVRKIDQRVRNKLTELAATDAEFAGLAGVTWVEAC